MIHFPSRTLRNATTVLLLLAATGALADEGVLVADLPAALTTPVLLDKAQRALVQGDWKVVDSDATSVDAQRKSGRNDCSVTLFVSDGVLKYRGSAKISQGWGAGKDAKMVTTEGPIPEGWLNELRSEFQQALAIPVPAPKAAAVAPPSAGAAGKTLSDGSTRDKLKELEELRKEGLVSEQEYQKMRQAVLDSF